MTIQRKLLIAFISLTFFSVSLLAFISINNSKETIQLEIENALNGIVDEKVVSIYSYIERKKENISTLAILPIVSDAMQTLDTAFVIGIDSEVYQQSDRKFRKILTVLQTKSKNYDLFLISPTGDIVFSVLRENDFATNIVTGRYRETQLAKVFKTVVKNKGTEISHYDSYEPSQSNLHNSGQEATKNKQNTIENIESIGEQSHSAFVASAIFHDGTFIGVLAMQLPSDDYFPLATDYSALKSTGEIVIAQMLASQAVIIAPLRRTPDAAFKLKFAMGSKDALPIQWSVSGQSGSGLSIGYEGTEILAAWRHIPELKWGVVVKIEAEEAFASAESLQTFFMAIGLVILLASSIVALLLSYKLSKPILHLVDATKKIANGDFLNQIKVETNDEIGRLAQSFNHMLIAKKADDLLIQKNTADLRASLLELERQKFAMDEHAIISSTNVEGKIIYANNKFSQVSGYNSGELIGQDHRVINSGFHSSDFFEELYATISKGDVWKGDICNRKKTGEFYWVNTTIVPFLNEVGSPFLYMAIRTEITENVNNADRLAALKDKLTKQVMELSRVNQELDQFAYVASHDLKSPLNGISQLVTWIEEDCEKILPDESKEHLVLLRSRSKRMINLLNDLLDYSRVGRQEHDVELFNLASLVNELFDLHGNNSKFECHATNIDMVLQQAPFELVMRNLISNAIKHHDKSNGKITITCEEKQGFYEITVLDNGPGIPPELHSKALEMFQTLQSRDKTEGSGMGLALVKKTIEHHGGSFRIVSKSGRGSEFVVKWPIGTLDDSHG